VQDAKNPQAIIERLDELFHDPVFWVATVASGLVVTIIGNYATRALDRFCATYRNSRLHQKGMADAAVQAAARHLAEHPSERYDLKLDVLYYGQRELFYTVASVIMVVFAAMEINVMRFSIGFAALAAAAVSWINVGVYFLREQRAKRILRSFYQLSNTKSYDDVVDEIISGHTG
jgi:hypothetical protein